MSSPAPGRTVWPVWCFILALTIAGCNHGPVNRSSSSVLFTSSKDSIAQLEVPVTDDLQIDLLFSLLIAEERSAIAAKDLHRLSALWDVDAQIIDRRGTEKPEDDYIWSGIPAILDRYTVAVFPFDPPAIEPPSGLIVSCHQGQSYLASKTDENDLGCLESGFSENLILSVSNGGDLWSFIYRDGRWWMRGLLYN